MTWLDVARFIPSEAEYDRINRYNETGAMLIPWLLLALGAVIAIGLFVAGLYAYGYPYLAVGAILRGAG